MKPEDVHPSHRVVDDGWLVSDPVCEICGHTPSSDAIRSPCIVPCKVPPKGWRCTRGAGHEGPCAAEPIAPLVSTDRWWAQRWIDKATPGELAAMRELLK